MRHHRPGRYLSRPGIAAIARDIRDHSADPAFLKAFWAQPGVRAAAVNLSQALRTTQDGKQISQPSQADHDNVLAILASAAIPLGFKSASAYMTYASQLNDGLTEAGSPQPTPERRAPAREDRDPPGAGHR